MLPDLLDLGTVIIKKDVRALKKSRGFDHFNRPSYSGTNAIQYY